MKIPHWYAVYTSPRAEKVVAQHLTIRGVENFLPLYRKVSRWKNGMKMNLDLPLFPGYVFVRISLCDRLPVLQSPSVVRLVGSASHPSALGDQELEILKARLAVVAAEPHPFVSVGDRVRVISGALAGLEGFLIQKKNDSRFVLSMDLIMQSMSVEIDVCDLEPVASVRPLYPNASYCAHPGTA